MTDLTTVLQGLSERAGKAQTWADAAYMTACPPALIQAMVDVVMALKVHLDDATGSLEAHQVMIDALDRLESVVQKLNKFSVFLDHDPS